MRHVGRGDTLYPKHTCFSNISVPYNIWVKPGFRFGLPNLVRVIDYRIFRLFRHSSQINIPFFNILHSLLCPQSEGAQMIPWIFEVRSKLGLCLLCCAPKLLIQMLILSQLPKLKVPVLTQNMAVLARWPLLVFTIYYPSQSLRSKT